MVPGRLHVGMVSREPVLYERTPCRFGGAVPVCILRLATMDTYVPVSAPHRRHESRGTFDAPQISAMYAETYGGVTDSVNVLTIGGGFSSAPGTGVR